MKVRFVCMIEAKFAVMEVKPGFSLPVAFIKESDGRPKLYDTLEEARNVIIREVERKIKEYRGGRLDFDNVLDTPQYVAGMAKNGEHITDEDGNWY